MPTLLLVKLVKLTQPPSPPSSEPLLLPQERIQTELALSSRCWEADVGRWSVLSGDGDT